MKLIRQVRLEFRQGTSDKVYEVDLCEVGPGQFVVNFRYGRRGSTLRDGSKTPAPVPQAKAEAVFNQLVASKRKEGYLDAGAPPGQAVPSAPAAPAAATTGPDAELEALRANLTPCPKCGEDRQAFRVKKEGPNKGRLFIKCTDPECDSFEWVTTSPGGGPVLTPRDQGVLARLREGFAPDARPARGKRAWRLSRAIWRAGELGLREAEPVLLDLLGQTQRLKAEQLRKPKGSQFDRDEVERLLGKKLLRLPPPQWRWRSAEWSEGFQPPADMFLYVLAWALARCGSAASVPALSDLRTEPWEPVGRIATAGLLLRLEGAERAALVEELIGQLPESLRGPARNGPASAVQQALQEHLARDAQPSPLLDLLYLIDNAHVRPAVLQALQTVSLRSTSFRGIRHLFKVAELRRDAEVFGVIGRRFETEPRGAAARIEVSANRYSQGQLSKTRTFVYPFAKDATRLYLRRRVWRTLRRLGELGDRDYVTLVVGVLLPFTDADGGEPAVWSSQYVRDPSTRRYRSVQRHRDRFGRYWAFNQILYRNSDRYESIPGKAFFSCTPDFPPGSAEPTAREEAFPQLWEAAPEALLRLLNESRCEPVHVFAAKAIRACGDFCQRLDVPQLVRLLESPYRVTVALGLDLAVQRYDPARPDHALVLALANSQLARARQQAWYWIDQDRSRFVQDQAFLAALVGSPHADTRTFARDWLRQTPLAPDAAQSLVARLIALLRSLTDQEAERARDTAQTLQLVFAEHLRRVGVDVVRDLLEHPSPEVRRFAGELVVGHESLGRHPPEDVLLRLLRDPDASVRGVGVRLLGQLPEDVLKRDVDVLVGLARHEMLDFRENVRPLIRRLAAGDRDFGRRIAERLVEALLVPGAPEGVPSHTARVLREDLREYLDKVPPATVFRLLQSRSSPAQEVGGLLLATNVRPEDLSLAEIVRLASHDILAVREAAWQMCRASLDRFRQDMTYATQLVDAKWEDSRQFAFGLLRDAFGRGELTPPVLVSLCDSVRPDVQAFGREMITRLFAEPDGPEYALKLSEHPSPSMQMFAANFLERYAGTDPVRLRELSFYFQSVLSRVNQGRVAKDRVYRFLEQAAQAGEESAAVVAEVLGRQSATAAIGDRARAIEILTRIHAAHPAVVMPLKVKPVEVRNGAS